jgi:hypothetical protein
MNDRKLLEQLFTFMASRNYISGDLESIRDMVLRYKQPPLTMHYRVGMQMTKPEYDALSALLMKIQAHLKPDEITENAIDEITGESDLIYARNLETGKLNQIGIVKSESI